MIEEGSRIQIDMFYFLPNLNKQKCFIGSSKDFQISVYEVAPVLPLTEHQAMKAYWGSGGTAPPIL
jgi:hypothetical protein